MRGVGWPLWPSKQAPKDPRNPGKSSGNPREIHGNMDFKMDLNGKNQGTTGFSNKPWLPEDN